MYRYFVDVAN